MGGLFATIALMTILMARDPPDINIKSLKKKKDEVPDAITHQDNTEPTPSVRQLIRQACLAIKNDYELVIANFMIFFLMG